MKNTGHHFQLSVTIAVPYWVYHDPNRRAQMVDAIRDTQYRWVILGILAYVVVEVAAAFPVSGIFLGFEDRGCDEVETTAVATVDTGIAAVRTWPLRL